jgi:hypothetical protein
LTAEIVVLNRLAVAMAADSAATITGGGVDKTSSFANKLFALCTDHPIGIMIYGNSYFMTLPWETIIKAYRTKHLHSQGFDTLRQYADDFISFLNYQNIPFPEHTEGHYIQSFTQALFSQIAEEIGDRLSREFEISDPDDTRVRTIIDETLTNINNKHRSNLQIINPSDVKTIMNRYRQGIRNSLAEISRGNAWSISPSSMRRRLISILRNAFSKTLLANVYTGVVVAGFGNKELLPSVKSFNVEGIIQFPDESPQREILKYIVDEDNSVGPEIEAAVLPFAQAEMYIDLCPE